jgi:hypothetical protein
MSNASVLDTSNANKSLWLVRIPQFVAEQLSSAENGDIVGSLQLSSTPAPGKAGVSNHQMKVTIAFNGEPEEFNMSEIPTGKQTVAFSLDQDKFKIKGKVSKSYNLNPVDSSTYRRVVQKRNADSSSTSKEVRSLNPDEIPHNSAGSQIIDFTLPEYAEKKRAAAMGLNPQSKRQKTDTDAKEIRNMIIQAFSTNERLTLKELSTLCPVAEVELKEQLKNYCTYNKKGIFKNFYELKSQYKTNVLR